LSARTIVDLFEYFNAPRRSISDAEGVFFFT